MTMKADVLLPAAGTSVRMKKQLPKQFQEVCGHPILAYTVHAFHRIPWIRNIVVAVDSLHVENTRCLMEKYAFHRVIICTGGKTRHRSIYSGVQALRDVCKPSDVLLIHDAARPFVPVDVVWKVASAAHAHKAAGVTRPLVSTVIRGDEGGKLVESLDRQVFRNSEMPQAFHYGVIADAYGKCSDYDLDYGTECLLLALKYSGCAAHLVEGTDDLWKVTYQKDLYAMESIVKEKLSRLKLINMCMDRASFSTEVENNMLGWPFKMASTEEGNDANTFIVLNNCWTETTVQHSYVESICSSVVMSCGCKSTAHQISLTPFIVILFVSAQQQNVEDNTDSQNYQINTQEKETNTTMCPKGDKNRVTSKERLDCSASNGLIYSTSPSSIPLSIDGSESSRSEKYLKLDSSVEKSGKLNTNTATETAGQAEEASKVVVYSQSFYNNTRGSHDRTACLSTLLHLKNSLVKALNNSPCTVCGILVEGSNDSLFDRLLSLIWHRSSYLDGQLLDWT